MQFRYWLQYRPKVSDNVGFSLGIGPKPKQWFRSYTTWHRSSLSFSFSPYDRVSRSFSQVLDSCFAIVNIGNIGWFIWFITMMMVIGVSIAVVTIRFRVCGPFDIVFDFGFTQDVKNTYQKLFIYKFVDIPQQCFALLLKYLK